MTDAPQDPKTQLLQAALTHVPFDGWSDLTLREAAADSGLSIDQARAMYPRGAVDLALAYHRSGDAAMVEALKSEDLSELRFRDRIARAVRLRLELVEDKELVRRGTTLFSLPTNAPDGARAIWETCDHIWTALGDTSNDVNWYTKRATLSGVYGSTVLYWLGDESPDHHRTWEFLDRRIDNVMQFEKFKAKSRENPLLKTLFAGPNAVLSKIRAPGADPLSNLPGTFRKTNSE
ncbi:COQ9 family protein [Actibacterium pelagium]|uniref:COQ9 C-terminal domain-containing protein n=1 Tax=Actibacterium pelagium TaxID=2029103 RepID=A0A917AGQ0_9RHOB|nr:COQ9 family protein [Actibacterium pelagium]GGE51535.1 hypothetical protein GCM10011517_19070 [Actibacterium pelagium]